MCVYRFADLCCLERKRSSGSELRPTASPSSPPNNIGDFPEPKLQVRPVDKSHRRSRSAGSMKSLTGSPGMPSNKKEGSGGFVSSSSNNNNNSSHTVKAPRPLVKQKSTLNKFFTVSKSKLESSAEALTNTSDAQYASTMASLADVSLQIAFADGKKKVINLKCSPSLTCREVLEMFLSKAGAKTKKFLSSKGLGSSDSLGLCLIDNQSQVWLKSTARLLRYAKSSDDVPSFSDLFLVDVVPAYVTGSWVTIKLVQNDGESVRLVDVDCKDTVQNITAKCVEVLGGQAQGFSVTTHSLYCCLQEGLVGQDKGFWLDGSLPLSEYEFPDCVELELRESNFVILATMEGMRFPLDGQSTGESFLRSQLAALGLDTSNSYYSLFKDSGKVEGDYVELPTWQTIANLGLVEKQLVHLCRLEEADAAPSRILSYYVLSCALMENIIVPVLESSTASGGAATADEPIDRTDQRDWHGFLKLYVHEDILSKMEGVELGLAQGVLCVTNASLIFKSDKQYLRIFHGMIAKIDKARRRKKKNGQSMEQMELQVLCKDFMLVSFGLPKATPKNFFDTLVMLAFPKLTEQLYAFTYRLPPSVTPNPQMSDGWKFYDPVFFHERMGIGTTNMEWVLSDINSNYEICDTYPAVLAFPAKCSQDVLKSSASFRSRGRLPALSYLHRNGASITRCSQPKVGLIGGSSGGDQILLQAILETNPNKEQPILRLMDARPKLNAMANQAMGKGSERVVHYPFECTLEFCSIDNIHVMRQSLVKVHEALQSSILGQVSFSEWLNLLGASGWLEHVHRVLLASLKVARYVAVDKNSVCLHCSDGWDRTAQLSSLSMIMLNPFFRTIRGFCELVEKEWLAFGHQFARRHGHADGKMDQDGDSQRSPVFFQFLDCVWQLINLNPCAFEYNSNFLCTVMDEVYNTRFGTFLYDCEKDRKDIRSKTVSLWTYIMSPSVVDLYRNPLFKPSLDAMLGEISGHSIQVWQDFHAKSVLKMREFGESPFFADHVVSAEARARELSMRIEQLETVIKKK